MKRLIFFLMAVLVATAVSAQSLEPQQGADSTAVVQSVTPKDGTSKSVVKTDDATTVTTVKVIPKFKSKHDLRAGVGSLSLASYCAVSDGFLEDVIDRGPQSFREEMLDANTYITPRHFVGNYSLSYTYHDRRWLQYGGTVVFGASTCWYKNTMTDQKLRNESIYVLSVLPTVRFVWFYREKVHLYSSVSIGVVTNFDFVVPWGDVTLVGCAFGRKLFGFVEAGCGMAGLARIGLGYHFDAKTKK